MAYRFTNTEKWNDSWFCSLSQIQMLLFIYLCDNCDIAGFIEVNYKRWSSDLNSSPETIEGAMKGLQRGLTLSESNDCVFINNFLKHQKNLPLNENNKAHIGIIRRFELYSFKFKITNINEFIEGASKGLQSPTGIGNGIGSGKSIPKYVYSKFYDSQIDKSGNDEKYIHFVKFLFGQNELSEKLNGVLSIEKQLTFEQFNKLIHLCQINKVKLLDTVLKMENDTKYYKSKKNLYLTLNNWINQRFTNK